MRKGFPVSSAGKEFACNAGEPDSIFGSGRAAGEGIGYPLQYSGLENAIDCTVHGVIKSRTRLTFTFQDKKGSAQYRFRGSFRELKFEMAIHIQVEMS